MIERYGENGSLILEGFKKFFYNIGVYIGNYKNFIFLEIYSEYENYDDYSEYYDYSEYDDYDYDYEYKFYDDYDNIFYDDNGYIRKSRNV